jgi:DNA-binding response OmpR family regulator
MEAHVGHAAGPQPARPCVLVVEGDPAIRAFICRAVAGCGANTLDAPDAHEAARVLGSGAGAAVGAALVSLGWGDAGLSAPTVLHAARPGLPCALLTGQTLGGTPPGFEAVLEKPFALCRLSACLDALLRAAPARQPGEGEAGGGEEVAGAAGLYRLLMEETRAAAARIRARVDELRARFPEAA